VVSVTTEANPGKVIVYVSSDVPEGRSIVINIDNNTLTVSELTQILVLFDGKEIDLADDYADVLNPYNEDVPEYLIIMGAWGIQVLVSIPHFSSYTITITKRTITPTIFERFNTILWGTPIVGDILKLLDAVVPGYGSLLFISLTTGILVPIVVIYRIRKRKRKPKTL
jgi:hypothetical protein